MGKVTVSARIENLTDLHYSQDGRLPADQVRFIEVSDALVDTGASGLLMPRRLIQQLGLKQFRTQRARGIGGTIDMPLFSVVRLTIQGRECAMDVGEIADEFPVIIGQIPLEALDWVLDLKNQKLIGNPEHGGEFMMDVF